MRDAAGLQGDDTNRGNLPYPVRIAFLLHIPAATKTCRTAALCKFLATVSIQRQDTGQCPGGFMRNLKLQAARAWRMARQECGLGGALAFPVALHPIPHSTEMNSAMDATGRMRHRETGAHVHLPREKKCFIWPWFQWGFHLIEGKAGSQIQTGGEPRCQTVAIAAVPPWVGTRRGAAPGSAGGS